MSGRFDGAGFFRIALFSLAAFFAQASLAGPLAYVPNAGDGTVSVIDTATDAIVTTITLGGARFNATVSPDGSRVYFQNLAQNNIAVVSTSTNTVTGTISLPNTPQFVVVTPDGRRLYVLAYGQNTVLVVDSSSGQVTATIPISNLQSAVITPDGSTVYVSTSTGTISVISTAANAVTATFPTAGVSVQGFAVMPDGKHVYAATGGGGVLVIDTATNAFTTIPIAGNPLSSSVAITPSGSFAYVSNPSINNVSVINTATNAVVATVAVAGDPWGLAVTPDGSKVFVAMQTAGKVAVISTATNTVVDTIAVGVNPVSYGAFIVGGSGSNPPKATLVSSLNPSTAGQSVTLIFTLPGASPFAPPVSGTVQFLDNGTQIASVAISSDGSAVYSTAGFTAGQHNLTGVYSGDASHSATSSAVLVQVVNPVTGGNPPPPPPPPSLTQASVALTSSQNPSAVNQSVTFTATVTGSSPSGTVTFLADGATLGSAQVNGGIATYATSTLVTGQHQISASYGGDANNYGAVSGTLTQNVQAFTPANGYWWNPAEPGRGFVIEIQGTTLFMAGFLYDASGRATWVASTGQMTSPSTYSGSLITYTGGQTLTGSYQSPAVSPSLGTISITFTANGAGTLTWPGGTIPIARFDIVNGGSSATQPASNPQTGWWWNPNEGGRGFALEVQGGQIYLAGYMYDTSGNPIWYLASGPMSNSSTFTGVWQLYGGGQTLTGAFKPPSLTAPNAGSVTLQFTDTATATLTLPNGRQIPFVRYQFGQQQTTTTAPGACTPSGDWETFQGNAAHTGFVPVTLNPAAFKDRWVWTAPRVGINPSNQLTTVTSANGQLYVGVTGYNTTGQRLYALKDTDASVTWNYDFSTLTFPSVNPPAVTGGKVYIAAGQQTSTYMWEFNTADGSLATRSQMSSQFEHYLAPTVCGGTIYQDSGTYGGLFAIDASSGSRTFFTNLPQFDQWTPAVDANNVYAYVGGQYAGDGASLYVIDRATGVVKSSIVDNSYQFASYSMHSAPVLGAAGSVFAVNAGNPNGNSLIDFNVTGGTIAWRVAGQYTGNPAYNAGTVYAVNKNPLQLEARSEADGSLLWAWVPQQPSETTFIGDVLLTQNLAFVSTDDLTYAIDLTTHKPVWNYPRSSRVALSASGVLTMVVTDANGVSTGVLIATTVK